MTQQQWDAHASHMKEHVAWPATKTQIVAACNGEDVEPAVLEDVKTNLPEGTYSTMEEVHNILVKM